MGRVPPDFCRRRSGDDLSRYWSIYHFRVNDAPAFDWFLGQHARELPGTMIEWLEAQAAAWLSIWEVIAVEPGASVSLRDLLSCEERTVHDRSASRRSSFVIACLRALSISRAIHFSVAPIRDRCCPGSLQGSSNWRGAGCGESGRFPNIGFATRGSVAI